MRSPAPHTKKLSTIVLHHKHNMSHSAASSFSASHAAAIDECSSTDKGEVSDVIVAHYTTTDEEADDDNYGNVDLESIFHRDARDIQNPEQDVPGRQDGSHGGPPLPRALGSKR